jgi:hypothetical protein
MGKRKKSSHQTQSFSMLWETFVIALFHAKAVVVQHKPYKREKRTPRCDFSIKIDRIHFLIAHFQL